MKCLYFAHDYSARNDERIVKLIREKGWSGYGLYWALVEKLHEAGGWLDVDFDDIAYNLRADVEEIQQIVKNYKLFIIDKKKFSSDRVLTNLEYRQARSTSAKKSADARWGSQKKTKKTEESKVKIPTIEEIAAYCKKRKNGIDAEAFFNFYESKGWMVGKNKMVKWQAAIITWEKNRNGTETKEKHIDALN